MSRVSSKRSMWNRTGSRIGLSGFNPLPLVGMLSVLMPLYGHCRGSGFLRSDSASIGDLGDRPGFLVNHPVRGERQVRSTPIGVVDATRYDRTIGIAGDEFDHDLLADARNELPAGHLPRPALRYPDPACRVVGVPPG